MRLQRFELGAERSFVRFVRPQQYAGVAEVAPLIVRKPAADREKTLRAARIRGDRRMRKIEFHLLHNLS